MEGYTFEDWLNGSEEPEFFTGKLTHESMKSFLDVKDEILAAKLKAFHLLVQMNLNWPEPFSLYNYPQHLNVEEKVFLAQKDLKSNLEIVTNYGLEKILRGPKGEELDFIDGDFYKMIIQKNLNNSLTVREKETINFLGEQVVHGRGLILADNPTLHAHIAYAKTKNLQKWIDEISLPEEEQKILNSLPQKLCVLYELGFLDILDERFNLKNCKARGPVTEKAKLLSTILGIDKFNSIRSALSKMDFLESKSAKKEAIKLIESHGLIVRKLIEPD
ncbi:hypothetical protein GCM10027284_42050 [Cyclobacterium sediminis]